MNGPFGIWVIGDRQPGGDVDALQLMHRAKAGEGNPAQGGDKPTGQTLVGQAEVTGAQSNPRATTVGGTDGLGVDASAATTSSETSARASAEAIDTLVRRVACRTRLSTTGYQPAMERVNNEQRSDGASLMTLSRAKEYLETAKLAYPSETLKNLAQLQQSQIYRTSGGELRGGIEMSVDELTECLQSCRSVGFANCDMQAMEIGLHLRHDLGITNFKCVSNTQLSHNYVVMDPSETFPKGAIVDTWTGQGVQPLDFKTKLKFRHFAANFSVNNNMHEWIERHGAKYVRKDGPGMGPDAGTSGSSK